jgi:hypothetical protein
VLVRIATSSAGSFVWNELAGLSGFGGERMLGYFYDVFKEGFCYFVMRNFRFFIFYLSPQFYKTQVRFLQNL